jgi:hypothetical protein
LPQGKYLVAEDEADGRGRERESWFREIVGDALLDISPLVYVLYQV